MASTTAPSGNVTPTTIVPTDISPSLTSLPLRYIIAAPMTAAIEAQALAAKSTVDFIQNVGFTHGTTASPIDPPKLLNVDFNYTIEDNSVEPKGSTDYKITAPLLSIIPIPYLRITDMSIDFVYNITTVQTADTTDANKSKLDTTITAHAGFAWWGVKTTIKGSISHDTSDTTHSGVTQNSTLHVHVNAVQDKMPGGLAIILAAITDAVAKSASAPDTSKPIVTSP